MTIQIYINNRPAEEYSQAELDEIKKTLTETAMMAAGLKKNNDVLPKTRRRRAAGA